MEIFARRQLRAWIDGASRIWQDLCFLSGSDAEGCQATPFTYRWHQVYQICSDTKFLPGIEDDYDQDVARDIS